MFEDFQVDRTELILTPKCLDIAVRRLDLFSVIFQFRLMGDCTLERANYLCVQSIRDSIKKLEGQNKLSNIDFDIFRIPGRMDYMIRLQNAGPGPGYESPNSFFDVMLNIFVSPEGGNIDRLQTTIGINPKDETGPGA